MAARSTTGPDAERKAVSDVHETGPPCAGQAVSHGNSGTRKRIDEPARV